MIGKKRINIGLELLRIWMSFEVILVHYWAHDRGIPSKYLKIFVDTKMLAVVVFMLVAFILSSDMIMNGTKEKIYSRFERLAVPYVGWAVIYWLIYCLMDLILKTDYVNGIGDLGWQLLFGSSPNLNAQMWYQFNLILLTVLFIIVFRCLKKHVLFVSGMMMIGCLILQYSNINGTIFLECPYEIIFPIGRICEMFPYACLGIFIGKSGIMEWLKKHTVKTIIGCIFLFVLVGKYMLFVTPAGYGYAGLNSLVITVFIVTTFYVLPFERLPQILSKGICFFSQYSLGVFAIHFMIGKLVNIYVCPRLGWMDNTFRGCILIYIISFLICFLLSKIPYKWCKRMVM